MPLLRPVMPSCSRSPSPPFLSPSHPRAPIATAALSPSPPHFGRGHVDGGGISANRRRTRRWGAVEKESEFEIDRDKAREALEKLDQQLRALSEKEIAPPKRRPPPPSSSSSYLDSDPDKSQMIGMRAVEPEFSGSYLAYSAVALLIFTIVNNIVFNVFIKPSVDGEEPAPTVVRKTSSNVTTQEAPPLEQQ